VSLAAIQKATSRLVPKLMQKFGVPCDVRRPESLEDQADNSTSVYWARLPRSIGIEQVIVSPITEAARRKEWGTESRARVLGVAALSLGLQTGDILRPRTGAYAGVPLEVVERAPSDAGSLVTLGLTQVHDRSEFGW
jgi:hypothetical protein